MLMSTISDSYPGTSNGSRRKDHKHPTDKTAKRNVSSRFWLLSALGALAVALSAYTFPKNDIYTPDHLAGKLRSYGIPEQAPRSTYLDDLGDSYGLTIPMQDKGIPDTTAVILNWSRLENVIMLSRLLCDPSLEAVIAKVIIWNNNPNVTLSSKV